MFKSTGPCVCVAFALVSMLVCERMRTRTQYSHCAVIRGVARNLIWWV